MKNILLLLLFISTSVLAQKQNEIEKLLNKELNNELKRISNSSYYGDTLIVIQPFKIENNVLSLTVKKKSYYDNSFYTERQEVALDKITTILKDINVIFETVEDAVTITQTNTDGEVSIKNYNLFFLQLSAEKNNEDLGQSIVKVFKKSGYTIEKTYWYD